MFPFLGRSTAFIYNRIAECSTGELAIQIDVRKSTRRNIKKEADADFIQSKCRFFSTEITRTACCVKEQEQSSCNPQGQAGSDCINRSSGPRYSTYS